MEFWTENGIMTLLTFVPNFENSSINYISNIFYWGYVHLDLNCPALKMFDFIHTWLDIIRLLAFQDIYFDQDFTTISCYVLTGLTVILCLLGIFQSINSKNSIHC